MSRGTRSAERKAVEFVMQEPGPVKLALYDVRGRLARTVTDGMFGSGRQSVAWKDAATTAASSGPGSAGRDSGAAGHTFSMRMVVVE